MKLAPNTIVVIAITLACAALPAFGGDTSIGQLISEFGGSQKPSAKAGKQLYFLKKTGNDGAPVSCATCHTNNPKAPGKTRANKEIAPLAPVANAERFTDRAKVEKWFRRNCNDVLDRDCTTKEKGDFLIYLQSIR